MSITDYFANEPTNSKVFLRSVSSATSTDISNIVIISVTGISKNSKSAQANKIRLSSNSVNFNYELSQLVADANAGDAWFALTSNKLTTSVSSGEFTNLLQTNSMQSNSIAFATANASTIPTISDPVITDISESPNTGKKENTIFAGLISGIVILVIFVVGCSFLCYRNKELIYLKMNWKKSTNDIETGGFFFNKYK
jgi:hypothetical protein